jgi:YD repeat-containing protein
MIKIAIALLVMTAGCADEAPAEGLSCPCGSGYVCCAENVCVAQGNACSASPPKPDATSDHPCNAVEDRNSDGTSDFNWTYAYDGAGRMVRGDGISPDGATHDIDTYSRSLAGQLTSSERTENGAYQYKLSRAYDPQGRLVEDDFAGQGLATTTNSWSYAGLTATEASTVTVPGVSVELVSTFDEDLTGHPQSGKIADEHGTQVGHWTFAYNADGDIVHQEQDLDTGVANTLDWTYDANRHITEVRESTGIVTRATYDDLGRKTTYSVQAAPDLPADTFTFQYCL